MKFSAGPSGIVDLVTRGCWEIYRGSVDRRVVTNARRRLWIEIVRCGLTRSDLDRFHHEKSWWPSLRGCDEIVELESVLPDRLREGDVCEPQILMHFPDEADEWPIDPHLDEVPPWANGRRYLHIVAVPLTDWNAMNGGLTFYDQDEPYVPSLIPGDVAVFDGDTPHSGGLNRSGDVRAGIYFRYLD